jgi:hypothetical protein
MQVYNIMFDGTGDLNGDGRSDVILRGADGTVVEWLVNGSSFAAPPSVVGTLAVDYSIAGASFRPDLSAEFIPDVRLDLKLRDCQSCRPKVRRLLFLRLPTARARNRNQLVESIGT